MTAPQFITAIGTPLTEEEDLHEAGLEAHLSDQLAAGISGFLVGGTMGLMQLLSDATYRQLAERSVQMVRGRVPVYIGAGDASFARTRDRILYLNTLDIDGVVILSPYLLTFSQEELIGYYTALAAVSRAPVYLYDLPILTRTKLRIETVVELSRHPNIRGIKCSDEAAMLRQLFDALQAEAAARPGAPPFHLFAAQPDMIDVLLRYGIRSHLDGIYTLAPTWVVQIGALADQGRWEEAATYQQKLYLIRRLLIRCGVFPTMTAILNARGIPGNFAPRPYRPLSEKEQEAVLSDPAAREVLEPPAKTQKPRPARV